MARGSALPEPPRTPLRNLRQPGRLFLFSYVKLYENVELTIVILLYRYSFDIGICIVIEC